MDFVDVDALVPLLGPDPYRCEKNWLPFIKDGLPHVVYSCNPFTIFQLDEETGDCATVVRYEPLMIFPVFVVLPPQLNLMVDIS